MFPQQGSVHRTQLCTVTTNGTRSSTVSPASPLSTPSSPSSSSSLSSSVVGGFGTATLLVRSRPISTPPPMASSKPQQHHSFQTSPPPTSSPYASSFALPPQSAIPIPSTPPQLGKKRSFLTLTPSPRSSAVNLIPSGPKRPRPARTTSIPSERPAWVTPVSDSPDLSAALADVVVKSNGVEGVIKGLIPKGGVAVLCVVEGRREHLRGLERVSGVLGGVEGGKVVSFAVSLCEQDDTPRRTGDAVLPWVWDESRRLLLRLGLLHPLGGGRTALDAVVVVDWRGRRRMLFPIGWQGREGVGEVEEMVWRVVRGCEWLVGEEESVEVEMEMD